MKIAVSGGLPFFLQLTPVMVHWGSCYTDPSVAAFDDPLWETSNLPCPTGSADNCGAPISPCPTVQNKHFADSLANPHVPSWNKTAYGDVPPAMVCRTLFCSSNKRLSIGLLPMCYLFALSQSVPPLSAWQAGREDIGYRNRTSSVVDLDDMIGAVLDGLEALGDDVVRDHTALQSILFAYAVATYVFYCNAGEQHLGYFYLR